MNFIRGMKAATLYKFIRDKKLILSPIELALPILELKALVLLKLETYLEDLFLQRCRIHLLPRNPGLGMPGRNKRHLFPTDLEFDFSWKSRMVSVEIHGGLDVPGSGHRTSSGVRRDMRKCNMAQLDGWLHLQLDSDQVLDNFTWNVQTLPMLEKALNRGRPSD